MIISDLRQQTLTCFGLCQGVKQLLRNKGYLYSGDPTCRIPRPEPERLFLESCLNP